MTQKRSRFALITALALFASVAAGCGGDDDSSKGGANGLEKSKITVATLPLVVDAPFYIALKHKLFEKEGLEVKPNLVAQSKLAVPGVVKGDIDVIYANDASMLQGHDNGALKIKLLAEGTTLSPKFMGVLVMPNSKIKTVADLKDKSVAVHILNNIQAMTFNAVAKANNIDPKSIKYKEVLLPQMGAALQKGDIEAMHGMEPFITDAQKKLGARLVIDGGAEPVKDMALDGYFSTDKWAEKNPKTAAAFQRAMIKASEIAADRKEVEAVLPTYAKGVDPETAKVMTMPGFPTSISATRIQRLIDLMAEQGQLKNKLDAKTIVFNGSSSS